MLFLLIVSPLVSLIMRLMIDQVSSLNNRGVSAAILSSNKGIDKDLVATAKEVPQRLLLKTTVGGFIFCCTTSQFVLCIKKPRPDHAQIQSIPGLVGDPSVQLETDRPGVEATMNEATLPTFTCMQCKQQPRKYYPRNVSILLNPRIFCLPKITRYTV